MRQKTSGRGPQSLFLVQATVPLMMKEVAANNPSNTMELVSDVKGIKEALSRCNTPIVSIA